VSVLSRVVFDPDTTAPSAPLSVTAIALSQTTIRVTWGASTDTGGSGLAGYRVLRSATSTGTYAQVGSDLSTASLSFDDTSLSAGTAYFYRVVAFDGNGNVSSASATVSATTQANTAWADVIVGMSAMPVQLAVAGRRVGLDLSGPDYGARADTVNGASVTKIPGGSWDGSTAIRIRPPNGSVDNPDHTYAGIANGIDIWNGGATNVGRCRVGYTMYCGSTYHIFGANAKVTGFLAAQTLGGLTSSGARTALFDQVYNGKRLYAPTSATVQSWHQPTSGYFPDSGPDTDKLIQQGSTINHAANPPQTGQEWLYWEEYVDYLRDLNPNGLSRVDCWARGGVYLGFIEIPLTHNASWNFAYQYIAAFEYLGGLFNNPSTADANSYIDVSHFRMVTNTAAPMGPPPGF
jgi:fibronectin type III domain protein